MGKRPTRNMMGRRYLMLTLVAVFCTAVPTTDLVIPEKIDFAAYSTSTSFLQAMSKSGGTEADCRTFATTTIDTIRTDVKSEQGILNAKDTGEDCADKGQDVVANAQGKLDAADKDQLAKQGVAATRLNAKKTACTASVAFNVNLDTLESEECYDSTKEQSYINAKSTCTSATSAMTKADKAVTTAKITVKDSQREHDDALAQAAQLKSACHCRVKKEQAEAWTAASTATAAHAADWKQAHEVICALDKKIPCEKVPDCPALEQVTLSKDISSEDCTLCGQAPSRNCIDKRSIFVEETGRFCNDSEFNSPQECLGAAGRITQIWLGVVDYDVVNNRCCRPEVACDGCPNLQQQDLQQQQQDLQKLQDLQRQ